MELKWLQLENFRNYDSLELDFTESKVLALVGPNAQGKTNVLESIAFLALGKSFRARRALETLGWDRPHGRIKAGVQNKKRDTELEIFLQRSPETKKVKKQSKVTTPTDFIGNLRVVLFTPDHLLLVHGSPSLRRQYLDRMLVQLSRDYVEALTQYQRILKQRNALLKAIHFGQSEDWELELWDVRLAHEAERIWSQRERFLNFLQKDIAALYRSISGTDETLTLEWKSHRDRFEDLLVAHRSSDIRMGSTSTGPHRDDFKLFLNGRELQEFGSRGECRSAILSLKMAEIHFMVEETGEKPLLLLDDVFSELDDDRQRHLGKLLKDYQAIITTTSLDHVKGLEDAQVYTVEGGGLTKVSKQ